ncbi:hypothetical protein NGM10_06175 [Halorussus salilacus]|uniref:hypothetical protein n=1 Tax=Halorussus salilacus TaxID=2953750 RepID=UPI00209F8E04|nr:hypothetical protein [Halorussus salilacus]USZ69321.1 hypothetical protein NGM10_06175 [Halorussus salilacus]
MGIRASMLSDGRENAAVGWVLLGVLALAAVGSLLDADPLWAGFALAAGALAALPAAFARDPEVMVPWEVVALAVLPVALRAVAGGRVVQVATYLAVAALALLVAVELDAFTSVEMSAGFAVGFVVVTTMATAGTWAVVQFAADRLLGTAFLTTPDALMWDLVFASLTGVLAGGLFEAYFHGEPFRIRRGERL